MSRDNSYRTGGIVLVVAVLAAIGFFFLTTETGEAPVVVDQGDGGAEPSAEAAEAREAAEETAAKLLAEKLAAEKASAQLAAEVALAEEAAAEQAAARKTAREARVAADRLAAEKAAAKLAAEKATAKEAAAKLAAETAAAEQVAAQKAAREAQAAADRLATENAAAEAQAEEDEAARAAKLAARKAAEVAAQAAQAATEQAAASVAASNAAEQARAAEEELARKARAAEAVAAEQAVAAAKAAADQAAEDARIAAEKASAAAAARIAIEEARRANDARIAAEEARRVEDARIAAETARAEPEVIVADGVTETPIEAAQEADPTVVTTDIDAPSFDLVRIAPDGGAVIAGRAQPNETVDITANGQVIGTARANARGEFVALLTAPPSEKPLSLALIARSDTGEPRPSAANVLILSGRQQDPDAGDLLDEAPIILRETVDSFEIVQPAPLPVPDQVVIDAIGYDRAGAVEISGRGRPTFLVRLYMNGRFVEQAEVDETGVWAMKLRDVEAGRYTLRVDEVDSEGKVASRAETPFQRIYPDQLPEVGETTDGRYTVQPGNNLWTIARNHYGEGLDYWQIFYANEGLIRDPDLIYPGQIFILPEQRGVEN